MSTAPVDPFAISPSVPLNVVDFLSAPVICNHPWRSVSGIFKLQTWLQLATPNVSFEDRIIAYTRPLFVDLPNARGIETLFRNLARKADQLLAIYQRNPGLRTECCSSETGYYPSSHVKQFHPCFFLCILCDRLMWSLEEQTTPFPDVERRPEATPSRLQVFPEEDQLQEWTQLVRACPDPATMTIRGQIASNLDLNVEYMGGVAFHHARARLHSTTANLLYMCAMTMGALQVCENSPQLIVFSCYLPRILPRTTSKN